MPTAMSASFIALPNVYAPWNMYPLRKFRRSGQRAALVVRARVRADHGDRGEARD